MEDIEEKLVEPPESMYEIEIGEETTLDLGKFQGNDLDLAFVNYDIQSASNEVLKDDFTVTGSFKNEKISLEIDLSQTDPTMVDSSVSGALSIANMKGKEVQYEIEF